MPQEPMILISRNLLEDLLDDQEPCRQWSTDDPTDWDAENERCTPNHKHECYRCLTRRLVQIALYGGY